MDKRGQVKAPAESERKEPSNQGISGEVFHAIFGPIFSVLRPIIKFLLILIVVAVIVLGSFVAYRYITVQQETGQLASTVTHAKVGAEKSLNPLQRITLAWSPDLYAALFDPKGANPYAIDSEVEAADINKQLGVKILQFEPIRKAFPPNTDIQLRATIQAGGFKDRSYKIEAYCSLDDYKNGAIIPAQLLGLDVTGNRGIVQPGVSREFIVQCNFPGGLAVTKQITSKEAHLTVVYDFATKAYQRIWFLNNPELRDLESRGVNPFQLYSISDPLLDNSRVAISKQTPGPLNLGLNIPFPQPMTTGAEYQMFVTASRPKSFGEGNLQTIKSLKIKVPSVGSLDIALKGEQEFTLASGVCDFEFAGETGDGYKEYSLLASKIAETNQNCDIKSLKDLALSEWDCISIFKQPVFTCNFAATRVPQKGLQSDIITSEAEYTIKVEQPAVVNIRATSQQLVA